jgi:hypothetical protein
MIGCSGGGEIIVFDTRDSPWRVCAVTPTSMQEENIEEIAPSLRSVPEFQTQ